MQTYSTRCSPKITRACCSFMPFELLGESLLPRASITARSSHRTSFFLHVSHSISRFPFSRENALPFVDAINWTSTHSRALLCFVANVSSLFLHTSILCLKKRILTMALSIDMPISRYSRLRNQPFQPVLRLCRFFPAQSHPFAE